MALNHVTLDDKYDLNRSHVFVTGYQALISLGGEMGAMDDDVAPCRPGAASSVISCKVKSVR